MRIPLRQRPPSDGNILPLINIVFLMLIFFLLAGTIAPTADFELKPAESSEAPPVAAPAMGVYVSAQGFISVAGTEVTKEEAPHAVAALVPHLEGEALEIVADRKSDAIEVLRLAEAAKAAGVARVKLITLRKPSE